MDLSGTHVFHQSNGPAVTFNFAQDDDGGLTGSGSFGGTTGTIFKSPADNPDNGGVFDDDVFFTVNWSQPAGSRGRYLGSRGPDGRLFGTTFDLNSPANQATWATTEKIPN